MKKYYFLLFLIFNIFVYSSCNRNENKKAKSQNYNYKQLEVYDSIIIPSLITDFADYLNKKFLFADFISGEIYIYDLSVRALFRFNHFGKGEEEYDHKGTNLNFFNDSLIAVGRQKSILLYDFKGNFVRSIPISESTIMPIRQMYHYNNNLIFKNANYNAEWFKFSIPKYKLVNLQSLKIKSFGNFPIYKHKTSNESLIVGENVAISCGSRNTFYITDAALSDIFCIDISSLKLIKQIKIQLDYFSTGIIDVKNTSFSIKKAYENSTLISKKHKIIKHFDNLYVIYNVKFSDKEFNALQKKTHNFTKLERIYSKFAISSYKNDEKIRKDIVIPSKFGDICTILNDDSLLIRTGPNRLEDSLGIAIYKFAKIVENE